ncbi:MAG: hypothetical protein R2822_15315 [Spirosomataceae bacterium]
MIKIALLIIWVFASTFIQAQQHFTIEELKVQKTIEKMFEALSNRDSVSLKAYCTSDVTFYEYGQIWNIDTLIKKGITMNKATDFKRTNSLSFSILQRTKLRHGLLTVLIQSCLKRVNNQLCNG